MEKTGITVRVEGKAWVVMRNSAIAQTNKIAAVHKKVRFIFKVCVKGETVMHCEKGEGL